MRSLPVLFFSGIVYAFAVTAKADTLTYGDLVRRLYDMPRLATAPAPGEKTALASSYDRASQYDAATDSYIHWDANGDGSGIVRMEGDEAVLADITGPGCIVRAWAARAEAGHVKIYLDGNATPTVDLPFSGYFDGSNAPFTRRHLVYKTDANGLDNFTPIPFQKSCKIVADPGWGSYYHFNYVTFPAGTVVPTFKFPLSAADNVALDRADRVFAHCGETPTENQRGQELVRKTVSVPVEDDVTIAEFDGPAAITALRVRFTTPLPPDLEAQRILLHQLALRITWDGQKSPAVWVPFGDFFGNSAGAVAHRNLPSGLTEDGTWYSYWYMPFASHAKIALDNDSGQAVGLEWQIACQPLKSAVGLLRFHAKWHRDALVPQRTDRKPDWTLLVTQGRGRYVGTQLHVWNPRDGWWGEGDEKFFVDGEKFPSTFGTGSEDYFGFAWSSGHPFVEALHSQPMNEDNHGNASLNRWHIPDDIPFQTSFEGCIEKYFPNDKPTLFAATAFWYLAPEGTDPYPALPPGDRVGFWRVMPPRFRETDAIEAEDMPVLKKGDFRVFAQSTLSVGTDTWSNDKHLLSWSMHQGEQVELGLDVALSGNYQVLVRFTHSFDYGIVQIAIDGLNLGVPADTYGPGVTVGDATTLGTHYLAAGKHVVRITLVDKNPASKGYHFAIDYFKLVEAP